MSEAQGGLPTRLCPACGCLMTKPGGSSFYWHADNNHPRCAITNVGEPPLVIQETTEAEPSPRTKRQKKNKAT